MDARRIRRLKADFLAALADKDDAVRRRPVRRLAARAPRPRARDQRARLAQPVHPHPAGAARRPTSSPASCPNITIIDLPSFRADPARHGCRSETVIAVNLDREADPDRRHRLCRRDEEVACSASSTILLPPQGVMPMHCSANIGPDGDTAIFFGLSRHRQDDAFGRRQPHADRRRRAWLVGHRRLQLRRRLLRQDDPPLARGRAGDLRDDQALRHGARECRDGSR